MPSIGRGWRNWLAEATLAAVAIVACLGWLGSTELWGKREQRAAAEALDTLAEGHWLVAEIQGRPRLEKPPLPRWVSAGLMAATGRVDESTVRLPNALAGLLTVGLVYAIARAGGGRGLGLAAGFALVGTPFFLVEIRQGGNDGFLTLFTTLAVFAGWRAVEPSTSRSRRWGWLFCAAVGLGFLSKGPIIFPLAGIPLAAAAIARAEGFAPARRLFDRWGLLALGVLVLGWPAAVVARHPSSLAVWWLEVGQKVGASGVDHDNDRGSILLEALALTLPWTPFVASKLLDPVVRAWRRRRGLEVEAVDPATRLAWWWAFGNLAMLGIWDVAKPSYFLPCLPAASILAARGWVRWSRAARGALSTHRARLARGSLQVGWGLLVASAVVAPVAAVELGLGREWLLASAAAGLAVGASTLAAVSAWRAGRDAWSLAASSVGLVSVALVGYAVVAPTQNASRGHRALASELDRALPAGSGPVWFFDDVDEGLWFYLKGRRLRPVPAADDPAAPGQPGRFNRGFALRLDPEVARPGLTRDEAAALRVRRAVDRLDRWADRVSAKASAEPAYLLIRAKLLGRLGNDLGPRFAPAFVEHNPDRNPLVLLRVGPDATNDATNAIASKPGRAPR